jgi:nucleotidyltransferase/DNA polymerase involved in DNA repair
MSKELVFRKILIEVLLQTSEGISYIESLAKKANVDPKQLRMGIEQEKEHAKTLGSSDIRLLAKIAIDHLKEVPDYYTKIQQIEKNNERKTS